MAKYLKYLSMTSATVSIAEIEAELSWNGITVKVINYLGDEVMKVFSMD